MQVLKNKTYNAILQAAREEFIRKGFKDASMREIAKQAGVGVGNIYNYFVNKDEIFTAIVKPAKEEIFTFITEQHTEENVDVNQLSAFNQFEESIDQYIDLIHRYKDELRLLMYGSDGSSMQGFREVFTGHIAQITSDYMLLEKKYYPTMREISPFFIHVLSSWMVSILGEILTHQLSRQKIREFFREYFRFEFAGWRELTATG